MVVPRARGHPNKKNRDVGGYFTLGQGSKIVHLLKPEKTLFGEIGHGSTKA